jgi:redox-sensing transcriptional repressor
MDLPDRTIERLSAYRRLLRRMLDEQKARVFSHELGSIGGHTAAQVRRDLMLIGYAGSPARGYDVAGLLERISVILDPPAGAGAALVGLGHLGSSLLAYFNRRHPRHLSVEVAFDIAPEKVGRVLLGCHCHPMDQLDSEVRRREIVTAIITVPTWAAQEVTDRLVAAGVRGILNFAPTRLWVPQDVCVEDVDISVSLEKVAYYARRQRGNREAAS